MKVAIIYKYVPQYRLPFFERLYDLCNADGCELKVIYGNPGQIDALKKHHVHFNPGTFVPNRFLELGGAELIWQPVLRHVRSADLVIAEQANKLLINYVLLAGQLVGLQRFAFWGHGRNMQTPLPNAFRERWKRQLARVPHWWFAYTQSGADYLTGVGFPASRITVVNNATDTRLLAQECQVVSTPELADLRRSLSIDTENVGIFIGSMYTEKRLEFLFEAILRVRETVPDFVMIFVGAGPEQDKVAAFCSSTPWARFVGSVFGRDRAVYLAVSKVMLMPGLVGLAILDSFAAGLPLVTTNVSFHSPEIDYLDDGRNGMIIRDPEDVGGYADAVAALLQNPSRLTEMSNCCKKAAQFFTIDNMARRFYDGIKKALQA